MNQASRDPWAGEPMSRSDAQRRYSNLVQYQLRPMLMNRRLEDTDRVQVLKRIVLSAHRFRYESGVVAQSGTREEVMDLLLDYLKPDAPYGEELRDWVKRAIRAFGGNLDTDD
jgi:hypothetical protein